MGDPDGRVNRVTCSITVNMKRVILQETTLILVEDETTFSKDKDYDGDILRFPRNNPSKDVTRSRRS